MANNIKVTNKIVALCTMMDTRISVLEHAVIKLNEQRINKLLEWAYIKYYEQVWFRPDKNIHKSAVKNIWEQVILKLGGSLEECETWIKNNT